MKTKSKIMLGLLIINLFLGILNLAVGNYFVSAVNFTAMSACFWVLHDWKGNW